MVKFAIVEFIGQKEMEIISIRWLKDNLCYWPPYKLSKLKKALKSHEEPGENWTISKVKVIKLVEKYSLAKHHLRKTEMTSDFTSLEDKGKGKRRKRKISLSLSSSDLSSEEENNCQLSKRKTNECFVSAPHRIESTFSLQDLYSPTSPKSTSNDDYCRENYQHSENLQLTEIMMKMLDEMKTFKTLLEQQNQIMENHNNLIMTFLHSSANQMGTTVVPVKSEHQNLPLDTMSDVIEFNENLKTGFGRDSLIQTLLTVGGVTLENTVRRMLRKLFTDNVAELMTLYGTKEKEGLTRFDNIYKALNGAVKKTSFFKCRTESDVEEIIKNWFRHAKARNSTRKSNGNSNSLFEPM